MKTKVSLKYFVNYYLWKVVSESNWPPDSFKLNFFDNCGNSKAFHTVFTKNYKYREAKKCKNLPYLVTAFPSFSV